MFRISVLFLTLLFLSFFTVSAQEKTQSKIRESKSLIVSFGYTATDYMGLANLTLGYNLSKFFTLNFNLYNTQFYRNEKIVQNYLVRCPQFEGASNSFSDQCSVYRNASNLSGDIALDYYPLDTPLFLASHIGYLPDSRMNVHLEKKNLAGNLTDSSIYYSAERNNTLLASLGGGFKIFSDDTYFLRFEFGVLQVLKADRKVTYALDEKGLVEAGRNPDIILLAYLYGNSSFDQNRRMPYVNLSAGVTF